MNELKIGKNRIQYKLVGQGKSMLFLHGAFSNGNTWRKVIPELAQQFQCIIPEWPFGGHKLAIQNPLDVTPVGITNLIAAVLDALNLDKVILVANDTGGAYAQIFATRYPNRISHLILSNCEGFEIFPPKKFHSLKYMVRIPGYLWLMSKLFKSTTFLKQNIAFGLLSHQLTGQNIFDLYVKNFVERKSIRTDFKKMAMEWDPKYTLKAANELSEFKKPVLVLWGNDDQELFPIELGRRIQAIFSNATFVEIPNAMTYIQEDNPRAFIENITTFLKR